MINPEVIERLKNIKIFVDLKGKEDCMHKIAELTTIKKVKSGETIIKEGDMGDELYIIHKGSVKVQKKTLQDELYTVVILKDSYNVYFGEMAIIDNDRRSATIIAETDCELICLSRNNFIKLCEGDPWMGYKIIMQISKQLVTSLRKMNQDVITLFEALVSEVEGYGIT